MNEYRTTIEAIKRPWTILFILFWVIFSSVRIIELAKFDWVALIFIVFGFSFLCIVLRQLFSKLEIIVSQDTLLVIKSIFNISYNTQTYTLADISEICIVHSATEKTAWNFGGLYISGKTNSIISFKYKQKIIHVGLTYNWTNIDETLTAIKKHKLRMNIYRK